MASKLNITNLDEIISRYINGESENALSKAYGIDRSTLHKRFVKAGIPLRNNKSANQLMMKSRTTEENKRNSHAAHEAAKNHVHTLEEKLKRAATRERKRLHVSADELYLAELLLKHGINSTPQKAIGVYNCDLAVGKVAIEIYGGNWHTTGRHAARSDVRFRYLLDQGWKVVVIWVDRRRWPLQPQVIAPVLRFIQHKGAENILVLNGAGQIIARETTNVTILRIQPRNIQADAA